MAFSHTIGGTTFTEASFQGNAYADEATGFPKALEKMVEHVANAYHGTSTDPLTVGAGAKALTISNGSGQVPAFAIGMPVRIARTSDPSGVWMQGEITVWDGATGIATINVDATKGAGSFSDWSVVIGGYLTSASGTPPLAVSQGGTGASSGKAALANLIHGVSGIIESNGNFVNAVIFGPALDPVDWSVKTAAATASLMLATVEDAGADTEVNIWDLTADDLAGPAPLATVTITGAAVPTSIAAAMGYVIVGHEDGITIIDPHDGTWAERTVGWPRSLSTSTSPALLTNNVVDVGAGFAQQPASDPRTGGGMPTFAVAYGTGTVAISVLKDDGALFSASSGSDIGTITGFLRGYVLHNQAPKDVRALKISTITADFSFAAGENFLRSFDGTAGAYNPSDVVAMDVAEDGAFAVATADYAMLGINAAVETSVDVLHARVTRTINTGMMLTGTVLAALANHVTDDNSYSNNDLTETGTITEAVVETGAELKAYSGFSSVNYLRRAYDADFDVTPFSAAFWMKSAGNAGTEYFFHRARPTPGTNPQYRCKFNPDGTIEFAQQSTVTDTATSASVYDDGKWHFVVCRKGTTNDDIFQLWVDGVLDGEDTTMNLGGSLTDTSATLSIGIDSDGSNAAVNVEMSMLRVSTGTISEAQIRAMYEAEKGMFVASAKCLLQSGSTDAVLDVSVDPITGKVAVTQTDAAMIFDGLVVESEPAIATGGSTLEHLKTYGDDLVQINDANLYTTIVAKDLRQDLEILRGIKAGLPGGIDLSKAIAWGAVHTNGTIYSSHNVKAVTSGATGYATVEFGVALKGARNDYSIIMTAVGDGSTVNGKVVAGIHSNADANFTNEFFIARCNYSNTGSTDVDTVVHFVVFGELDNE
jgi:hypothetical protein